jgi:hypothetical protein
MADDGAGEGLAQNDIGVFAGRQSKASSRGVILDVPRQLRLARCELLQVPLPPKSQRAFALLYQSHEVGSALGKMVNSRPQHPYP